MNLQTLADGYDESVDYDSRQTAIRAIVEWMIGKSKTTIISDIADLTNPQATKDLLTEWVTCNAPVLFATGV